MIPPRLKSILIYKNDIIKLMIVKVKRDEAFYLFSIVRIVNLNATF